LLRRTVPTSVSPSLDIYSVTVATISRNTLSVPIKIATSKSKTVETLSLIDSGAGGAFIDQNYAKNFDIQHLDEPIKAYNVDGTENKKGTIKSFVDLEFRIDGRKFNERLYVTGLGKQKVILGFPWLSKHNPIIDWKQGRINWKPFKIDWKKFFEKGEVVRKPYKIDWKRLFEIGRKKKEERRPKVEEIPDEEERKNHTTTPFEQEGSEILLELLETDIRRINVSTELAIEESNKKTELTDEEIVPKELHDYLDVFSEEKAHRFPESRPWDHKIEMKEGFEPKSFKNYNLTPAEQLELDKFLKENLEKGYIKPSQSPMASPFFFVSKKDGKLRPCQDYRYLNDWTITGI